MSTGGNHIVSAVCVFHGATAIFPKKDKDFCCGKIFDIVPFCTKRQKVINPKEECGSAVYMNQENLLWKRTTPEAMARQGAMARIRTTAWSGKLSLADLKSCGVRLRPSPDLCNLIPSPYKDSIFSVSYKRETVFRRYSIDTVFGRFMPAAAIARWEDIDTPLRNSLVLSYRNLAADYEHLRKHARHLGRQHSLEEWRLINKGDSGSPSPPFFSSVEDKFESQVPSASEIVSSGVFWTDYFPVPFLSFTGNGAACDETVEKIVLEKCPAITTILGKTFVTGVISKVRRLVEETCNLILDNRTAVGGINMSVADKFDMLVDSLSVLYFFGHSETDGYIKSLKDSAKIWHNDPAKVLEEVAALKQAAFTSLDEMTLEQERSSHGQ